MKQNFQQSLEVVGLSQVSKMLHQLTEQFSARYSSKIKKILFYVFFVRTKDHILQLFFLKLTEILLNFCQTSKVCNSLLSTDSKQLGSE